MAKTKEKKETKKAEQARPFLPGKKVFLSGKKIYLLTPIVVVVLLIVAVGAFKLFFLDKIYPLIYIANTNISVLTLAEADKKVSKAISQRGSSPIIFEYQNQKYEVDLKSTTKVDSSEALEIAKTYGRSKPYLQKINLDPSINFDKDLDSQLDKISLSITQPTINSQLKLEGDQINVTPSQNGLTLDQDATKKILIEYILTGKKPNTSLPTKITYPALSYQTALTIKKSLDSIKLNPLKLYFKNQSWELDQATVLGLIDLNRSAPSLASGTVNDQAVNIASIQVGNREYTDSKVALDEERLQAHLGNIASLINQDVEEPLFNFDGKKVVEFRPPQEGRKLDTKKTAQLITQNLLSAEPKDIPLPVNIIEPKNKLANELGIKEQIGVGFSNFAGSIVNRIYNVNHGASKINGILIAPGEEFSWNKTVGDITAATGFKQAYVIKSGRTVLDDGGGICQVSTTLFRAVLNAGLPITSRTAHAYRVSYYEQGFPPGLDATIFYPSVDFRFKNDTLASILIQTSVAGTTMSVNLYGTSDGRTTQLTKSVIASQTPPPPELRQDDPTLPKGTVKQVDWAAWGARVSFSRIVTKNGEAKTENFFSNYRPWQAVYIVGTQ